MIRPFLGDSVLGIHNLNANAKILNVFPNPALDKINIDYPYEKTGKEIIIITDITGRKVYENHFTNDQINISFLNSGVYIMHLQDEQNQGSPVRFIKD